MFYILIVQRLFFRKQFSSVVSHSELHIEICLYLSNNLIFLCDNVINNSNYIGDKISVLGVI